MKELPRSVGELLDAYHTSTAEMEPDRPLWLEIQFAVAEAMDQECVRFFYHRKTAILFQRTDDDLILHRYKEADRLMLAPYIARSIAPVYEQLLAERDVWLRYERAEAIGDYGPFLRITIRDASGCEHSWCVAEEKVVGTLVRVRRADLSDELSVPVPDHWIAIVPIEHGCDSGNALPLYFVTADRIKPAPVRHEMR